MRHKKEHRVSDARAAIVLGNGHPKCDPPSFHTSTPPLPDGPGEGAAPGADGPPTTGAEGSGGPLGST